MTRIARGALGDGLYHAYSRGVFQQAIFTDEIDFRLFWSMLGRTERRFGWRLHAACLVPTHFHVVLETTVSALSGGMHRLKGLYAQQFNERYNRYGHVFASRFGCRLIEDENYFGTVCRYVLENPVRAGLCETASDWPWSLPRP